MSTTPLFPDLPEMLSPRAKWMRDNKCLTYFSNVGDPEFNIWMADFDDGTRTFENAADYFCQETGEDGDSRIGQGAIPLDGEDQRVRADLRAVVRGSELHAFRGRARSLERG